MQAADFAAGPVGGAGVARHVATTPSDGNAVWRVFAQTPDLINGDATNFSFIFLSAGLAAPYHWLADRVLAAMPEATSEATLTNRIVREAAFHSLMITSAAIPAAKARTIALLIAVSRVQMRRTWAVATADIVGTQLYNPVAADGTAVSVNAAGALSAPIDGLCTVAAYAAEVAHVAADFAANCEALYAKAALCAIGMPACNGVIIVMTTVHHYQDPHKQVCDSVIDQYIESTAVFPNALTRDELKDALCHKAAHPIKSPILVGLARSPAVKLRLAALGCGAANVRVPAQFQTERTVGAYLALVGKAAQCAGEMNVAIDVGVVAALKVDVEAAIAANPNQTGVNNATALIEAFKTLHGAEVAKCAGLFAASLDEAAIPADHRSRSTLTAHAVANLVHENNHAYVSGHNHYSNAVRWHRARAREGHLPGLGLMGAPAPAAFTNPGN